MSQFYNKYRHLFINKEKPIDRSYLKPYMNQMGTRAHSLNYMHRDSTQISKSAPADRFQTQILPEIKKLIKQTQKYRISTQIASPPFLYSPQVSNKYNRNQSTKTEGNFNTLNGPIPTKNSQQFRRNFYRQFKPVKNNFASIQSITNPEQVKQMHSKRQQQIIIRNIRAKTEAAEEMKGNIKLLPRIDRIRMNYGYPQINYGLIFSEYQKQNQFQLVNNRLRDIRWLEKYYPRGNLNSYREALVRRNQSKKNIQERRSRLKVLLETEKNQYQKDQPII